MLQINFKYLLGQFGSAVITIALLASCANQIPLSKVNLEYQLDTKLTLIVRSRVYIPDENIYALVRIQFPNKPPDPSDISLKQQYNLTYQVRDSYDSDIPTPKDSVTQEQIFRYANGDFGLKIRLTATSPRSLFLLVIEEKITKQVYEQDMLIDLENDKETYQFALKEEHDPEPLVENYYTQGEKVKLIAPKNYFLRYIPDQFAPALPAMTLTRLAKGPGIKNTKSVSATEEEAIKDAGLYNVVMDTVNKKSGYSFIVFTGKYPKFTKPDELVKPLVYITTKDEKKKLFESTLPKYSLDQFWINIGSNLDNARRIIREYYTSVEGANKLFTTYKEGWKTDKGIIYIIFGKPTKVYKTENLETWIYVQESSQLQYKFEFTRKPTIFTADNWELNRFSEYADYWYSTVETWRKGILKN